MSDEDYYYYWGFSVFTTFKFFLYGLFFFFDFYAFGIDLGNSLAIGLFTDFTFTPGFSPFLPDFPLLVSVLDDFSFFPFLDFERAPLVELCIGLRDTLRPGIDFYSFLWLLEMDYFLFDPSRYFFPEFVLVLLDRDYWSLGFFEFVLRIFPVDFFNSSHFLASALKYYFFDCP